MTKYKCTICGWIYDPEAGLPDQGIDPGTPFENISESFRCPECGAKKKWFEKIKD
ncbi:MAG: rubredoxin [Thermoplasmata archaeon]|nr:MAG: rubredoxin [Thermoplasmata archaeon]